MGSVREISLVSSRTRDEILKYFSKNRQEEGWSLTLGGQRIQKKDHPAPPSLTTTALNGAADTGENKGPTNDARVALRVVRRLTAPFFLFPSCSFHASMTPPPLHSPMFKKKDAGRKRAKAEDPPSAAPSNIVHCPPPTTNRSRAHVRCLCGKRKVHPSPPSPPPPLQQYLI